MNILILEDNGERTRQFRTNWGYKTNLVFVETAESAIEALKRTIAFDMVFLDHDLGGEEMVGTEGSNTGSEVVRWMTGDGLATMQVYIDRNIPIIIHSLNGPAAESMEKALNEALFSVQRIPFLNIFERIKIR